jgi:hypothetical protein
MFITKVGETLSHTPEQILDTWFKRLRLLAETNFSNWCIGKEMKNKQQP